jgi:hypothetical protein
VRREALRKIKAGAPGPSVRTGDSTDPGRDVVGLKADIHLYPRYPSPMQVVLEIPDEFAARIAPNGENPSRAALEALALEGYRSERLSESEIQTLLGFETRMEVHAFLKAHNCYLHYSADDLERDRETAARTREKRRASAA